MLSDTSLATEWVNTQYDGGFYFIIHRYVECSIIRIQSKIYVYNGNRKVDGSISCVDGSVIGDI